MTITIRKTAYIFLLLLLLVGCRAQSPKETEAVKKVIPTPQPGTGNLYGIMMNSETGKPYEAALFLSRNLTLDQPGYPPLVSFSYQNDPRAKQESDGSFVFENIKPGKYVLTLLQAHTSEYYIKKNSKGEKELIMLEVKADQSIDLGTLSYP